jgi:hypothetical protein
MIDHETQTLQSLCSTVSNSKPIIYIYIYSTTLHFATSYIFPSTHVFTLNSIWYLWLSTWKLTFLRHRLRYQRRVKIKESENFQQGLESKQDSHWTVLGSVRGLSKRSICWLLRPRKLGLWFPPADQRNWSSLHSGRRRSRDSSDKTLIGEFNWELQFSRQKLVVPTELREWIVDPYRP